MDYFRHCTVWRKTFLQRGGWASVWDGPANWKTADTDPHQRGSLYCLWTTCRHPLLGQPQVQHGRCNVATAHIYRVPLKALIATLLDHHLSETLFPFAPAPSTRWKVGMLWFAPDWKQLSNKYAAHCCIGGSCIQTDRKCGCNTCYTLCRGCLGVGFFLKKSVYDDATHFRTTIVAVAVHLHMEGYIYLLAFLDPEKQGGWRSCRTSLPRCSHSGGHSNRLCGGLYLLVNLSLCPGTCIHVYHTSLRLKYSCQSSE